MFACFQFLKHQEAIFANEVFGNLTSRTKFLVGTGVLFASTLLTMAVTKIVSLRTGLGIALSPLTALTVLVGATKFAQLRMNSVIEANIPSVVDMLVTYMNLGYSAQTSWREVISRQTVQQQVRLRWVLEAESAVDAQRFPNLAALTKCFGLAKQNQPHPAEHFRVLQLKLRARTQFRQAKRTAIQQVVIQWGLVVGIFLCFMAWGLVQGRLLQTPAFKAAFGLIVVGSICFWRTVRGFRWRI